MLKTRNWKIVNIPGTNDLTAIQLKGNYGTLAIFNIYNDCTHSDTENALRTFLREHTGEFRTDNRKHIIWAGDFNWHHPMWDRDKDTQLFTNHSQREAIRLISLLADHDMAMPLPKGIPTLQHMVTGLYSRPDNLFCSAELQDMITNCDTDTSMQPPCTDHFPITTHIMLTQIRTSSVNNYNFRDVEWEEFRNKLTENLDKFPSPTSIPTETDLNSAATNLTEAIQHTIQTCVKCSKPCLDAKQWWNSDLKKRRKEVNKLRAILYRNRALTNHPVHQELRVASNKYGKEIIQAKYQHWTNYLEEMDASGIWTANKFLKEPAGDGGSPRIPTLKVTNQDRQSTEVTDSQEKATLFVRTFFPSPPDDSNIPPEYNYPILLPDPPLITRQQIEQQIRRLSPYKAYGPNEIPNIILQKCLDIIIDYLYHIYRSILKLGIYYGPW